MAEVVIRMVVSAGRLEEWQRQAVMRVVVAARMRGLPQTITIATAVLPAQSAAEVRNRAPWDPAVLRPCRSVPTAPVSVSRNPAVPIRQLVHQEGLRITPAQTLCLMPRSLPVIPFHSVHLHLRHFLSSALLVFPVNFHLA